MKKIKGVFKKGWFWLTIVGVAILTANILVMILVPTKQDWNIRLLTFFGGWISGMATIVLGCIALWQNATHKKMADEKDRKRDLRFAYEKLVEFLDNKEMALKIATCNDAKSNAEGMLIYSNLNSQLNLLVQGYLLCSHRDSDEKIVVSYHMLKELISDIRKEIDCRENNDRSIDLLGYELIARNRLKYYVYLNYYKEVNLESNIIWSLDKEQELEYLNYFNNKILDNCFNELTEQEQQEVADYVKSRTLIVHNKEKDNG